MLRENKPVDDNNEQQQQLLPMPSKVVVTYIVRQGTRRRLTDEDHNLLVEALEEMAKRHGWELNVVQAERLNKDEQVRIMAKTTVLPHLQIMLGVHGNGLTHLVLMPPTRVSAVIEIFIPGGFAHDYQWTTHALGMRHFAVWNDTSVTLFIGCFHFPLV
jgi:capsular polysaccharide biosynthesis protein